MPNVNKRTQKQNKKSQTELLGFSIKCYSNWFYINKSQSTFAFSYKFLEVIC